MNNSTTVVLKWPAGSLEGSIVVTHGELVEVRVAQGTGMATGACFQITSPGVCALAVTCRNVHLETGGCSTRVSLNIKGRSFTFFMRDVTIECPIWMPSSGTVVTMPDDDRCYDAVVAAIQARGLLNYQQRINLEPEENYTAAASAVRAQINETWLGLSRDIRIFRINANFPECCWGIVQPYLSGHALPVSEKTFKGYFHPATNAGIPILQYRFHIGRGSGSIVNIARRLDKGCLPILHSTQCDDEMRYELTAFVAPVDRPLTAATLQGTPCLVADYHSTVHVFTPEQQAEFEREEPLEQSRRKPLLLFIRVRAVNTAAVPRYAWFKSLSLAHPKSSLHKIVTRHASNGLSVVNVDDEDLAIAMQRVNDLPMAEPEQAVLVPPGGAAIFDLLIPHRPIALAQMDQIRPGEFVKRETECRAFWQTKLEQFACVKLPETRIEEMVRSGLLHLDMIAYGREPDGPLVPAIGQYAPLAFESAPIMLAFDMFGRPDLARRALEFYFLKKQQPDGRLHNYAKSMGETGPVLYVLGEHYRFTRDMPWFQRLAPYALKACEYLIGLRRINQREACRGINYGLFAGGVCDNEIPECVFVNNAYACLGLQRTSEWLQMIDPDKARTIAREADAWRADIRTALMDAMARSPVVPLADGTWRPSVPPTAEGVGNYHLFCDGKPRFSHGAMQSDDVLLGPIWLAFLEILNPRERLFEDILFYQTELFMTRNVALSQPFLSRHDYAHLRRGEVKAFLKYYYNGLASMADRETYTWNEHTHGGGMHKTEEEAWFLLQTRWMLLIDEGQNLHLLQGIPRAWLSAGGRIALHGMPSYFGRVSLDVDAAPDSRSLSAHYALSGGKTPENIRLRLPHPFNCRPRIVQGGVYDHATECMIINNPPADGAVRLEF